MASISKLPSGKWRARYRDEAGREHARHFDRKTDGQRWLDGVTASTVAGTYVAPQAGKVTFRDYAEQWRPLKLHGPAAARQVEMHLRVHAYPAFGHLPIAKITSAHLKTWLLSLPLADSTKGVVLGTVKGVFASAVEDRVIVTSPTKGVSVLTRASVHEMWIPTWKQVNAIRAELPERYRAVVDLVVGSGLRQGEFLGLEVDGIDFLRARSVVVRRQRQENPSPVHLSAPKTQHSHRSIPVASVTLEALSEHIRRHARVCQVYDGTSPERQRGVPLTELGRDAHLLFCSSDGELLRHTQWWAIWRSAASAAGWPTRRAGVHSLRHFYASGLIRHGESAPTVCRRLGHASPHITLNTYAHLWPDSEATTRRAVEEMFAEHDDQAGDGLSGTR